MIENVKVSLCDTVNLEGTHSNPTQRMASSGMLRRVDLVRTDVSEELSASIIKVTRIGELGTLAVNISSQLASVARYGLRS
jgi:hypothetical protein